MSETQGPATGDELGPVGWGKTRSYIIVCEVSDAAPDGPDAADELLDALCRMRDPEWVECFDSCDELEN